MFCFTGSIYLACDEIGCHEQADISCYCRTNGVKVARAAGWAISRDRKKCYCPKHAYGRTSVGCRGYRNI